MSQDLHKSEKERVDRRFDAFLQISMTIIGFGLIIFCLMLLVLVPSTEPFFLLYLGCGVIAGIIALHTADKL